MPSVHSSPWYQMDNPAILSLLRHNNNTTTTNSGSGGKRNKSSTGGGLLKVLKLFPMLTSGCKMVALLGRSPRKALLKDNATTGTIFGYRKGRVSLAIQEDPHCMPIFVIELPMQSSAFHKEMASDIVRIALESETRTHKKKLLEEFVWAVYCNGRKIGYSIRRKTMAEDELHVMQTLRGVSMGAGVLPCSSDQKESAADGELTYMRARFERVIGSKDSESLYMINPEGAATGPELSIFFVRAH
ncbi:protein MIZU-KUSSEI 1-like [Quillaja saponaria]|uniref:Protein MIZU-KUSSEI 1-like n=1 Tax=Quillaja saponaria TaxID=32244 RepID=A0AAD7PSU3_QUISA|nr:protein MIZU-KUSSEI 1-like [Quillaja saponaria]